MNKRTLSKELSDVAVDLSRQRIRVLMSKKKLDGAMPFSSDNVLVPRSELDKIKTELANISGRINQNIAQIGKMRALLDSIHPENEFAYDEYSDSKLERDVL